MDEIELVIPNKKLEIGALEYKKEHFHNGEDEMHGSALFDKTNSYDDWLIQLKNNSDETTVNSKWVVSTTFFAVRKCDGKIDIRHTLNEFLKEYGGNIGYGVRPSERKKGYATEILKMALEYCKKLDLKKVMLACYKENEASSKTITKCGCILEKEFMYTDKKIVQTFWIAL